MEKKKCCFKKHEEIDANYYCDKCKIYMCNKCENFHSDLFQNHHSSNLDKETKEIFTGFCKEKNHFNELKFYCKKHNILCCAACISKIKDNEYGQHKDCEVCKIDDIKNEKKNKLKDNIKLLENLSNTLEESINELKKIFEKINENKEKIKLKIQNIFTKIRNTLNEREDVLLLEVDKQFNILFFNEDIIKEGEKLPNKIKVSLDKGKKIENEWNDDNKLNSLINDCINIENNIKDINIINESLNKNNSNDLKLNFYPGDEDINTFLDTIKSFGSINYNKFSFKNCPKDINENKKYVVSGNNNNIITKIGNTQYKWVGIIYENQLSMNKENIWKIKILKTNNKFIMIGVAPIDFNINSSSYSNCGWYLYCYDLTLYSGPPHNYSRKGTNLNKVNDEITVIMNMNKGTLKFIINNEDKGDSYTNIPLDKPLAPVVFLDELNDSVEIISC